MKEIMFFTFILLVVVSFFMWLLSLIKPKAKIFQIFGSKRYGSRRRLTKLYLITTFLMFFGLLITAPHLKTELLDLNIINVTETVDDKLVVKGSIKGDIVSFKINNEDVLVKKGSFNHTVELQPGVNKIALSLIGKNEKKEEIEAYSKEHEVFFDYEGMLYAKEQEREEAEDRSLKEKLSKIPEYEIVRREDIGDGFSGIVYSEDNLEDYQMANLINDLRKNNGFKNLTILVINKSDKDTAEKIFEDSDPAKLLPYIKADYEKRDERQELFWFPEGIEGKKIALEVKG